jgi:hypothetical protein
MRNETLGGGGKDETCVGAKDCIDDYRRRQDTMDLDLSLSVLLFAASEENVSYKNTDKLHPWKSRSATCK